MPPNPTGFPRHVDTSAAVGSYWLGLARQQMQFQQVLGELVDNAIAAPKKDRDGDDVPIRIEVIVVFEDPTIKLTVADDGHGISLEDLESKVLRPGGQGSEKGVLNEHGFGLKNALCMLTRNEDGFLIRTRDATCPFDDKQYLVRGPFSQTTMVDLEDSSVWNENLAHVNERVGTRIFAETSFDFFQTLYARGLRFDTLMTRLLEHLGVMYRHYLSDANNKLWVRWKEITGAATSFVETRVRPIQIPYVRNQATKTYPFEIQEGNERATASYEYGTLDRGARQTSAGTDWDPSLPHPFPLMIYYRGNLRTQGIDISVRNRVILNGIMERIWEDVPRHNDWNDFVGELRLDGHFRTVNNKTDVDPHNPYWVKLLEILVDQETYMAERSTRAKSEKALKEKLKTGLEANIAGSEAQLEWPIGGGIGVKIDIYHKKPGRHVDVYEAKMGTSTPLDLYQLLMYWDLVTPTNITIDSGRLIADEHPESVRRLARQINKRKDAKGRKYNLIVKRASEVLPR